MRRSESRLTEEAGLQSGVARYYHNCRPVPRRNDCTFRLVYLSQPSFLRPAATTNHTPNAKATSTIKMELQLNNDGERTAT